jgi:hypothetical protein
MLHHVVALTLILGIIQPQHELRDQPLEFVLTAEKSTYFVYEPVIFDMTFINKGQQPIQADFYFLDFRNKQLTLFYRKNGSGFKRYYSELIRKARNANIVTLRWDTLEPSDQVSMKEMVLFDIDPSMRKEGKFVLDEPGEYEFQASSLYLFEGTWREIKSNILRITVVDSQEQEQEALTWWKDKDLAIVVQGDDSSAERIKKLRVFLQQFPQSLYATAVRTSSERLKSHLAQKAKEKKLTEDEKELYELLRLNN